MSLESHCCHSKREPEDLDGMAREKVCSDACGPECLPCRPTKARPATRPSLCSLIRSTDKPGTGPQPQDPGPRPQGGLGWRQTSNSHRLEHRGHGGEPAAGLDGLGWQGPRDHLTASPLACLPCQVLEDNGMLMDDDQYALLTAKLGYKKEGMSYLDFATGFEGS